MLAAMGLVLTVTAGLIVWIVMWSLDVKAIDAFLITIIIALVGATVRILLPHFPGRRE
jgi:hypothetical protein